MLWLSDPKALQYIYQTSGYNFPKQPERRVLSGLIGDHGLTWADGASELYVTTGQVHAEDRIRGNT